MFSIKNIIRHVVYSHRKGLRWYFKSTELKGMFVISLYLCDIKLLRYNLYSLLSHLNKLILKVTGNFMLYCSVCGSPLRYIGETKDKNGNTINIYSCPKCNKLIYI